MPLLIAKAVVVLSCLVLSACQAIPLSLPLQKPSGIYHTVQKHQTLWRICTTYNVNMQYVAEINNIRDPAHIKAGDRIFIPGATAVRGVPVPADTKPPRQPAPPETAIIHETHTFIWPVKGRIIKNFGIVDGMKHDGINISAPAGTDIVAAQSGRVVFSAMLEGYGNTIIMQHAGNYATVYANNSANLVEKGTWIKQGTRIAKVGRPEDGQASSHLHFQIRHTNRPRNPLFHLP
jgi:murein DD-endopeptidase MepM/ murein hydrolase activator NlpD